MPKGKPRPKKNLASQRVIAALKTAELFLAHGLSQSRARWPMATAKTLYSLDHQPSVQGGT